jgi:hypothetical protein
MGLRHRGLALAGGVAEHEIAAGRKRIAQPGHDLPGTVGIGDDVQDCDEQNSGGLGEVDQRPTVRVVRIFSGSRRSASMIAALAFRPSTRNPTNCAIQVRIPGSFSQG